MGGLLASLALTDFIEAYPSVRCPRHGITTSTIGQTADATWGRGRPCDLSARRRSQDDEHYYADK
ncbi:MAG: hypothetical protein LC808_41975 [Actinobacteria bacterium]|nr:hypothetical protein [Actinomycetota bacterium]